MADIRGSPVDRCVKVILNWEARLDGYDRLTVRVNRKQLGTDRHWANACAVAGRFGIQCERVSKPRLRWDGAFLRAFSSCELFHEIGHYQCASESRRWREEFALGAAVGSTGYPKRVLVRGTHGNAEESLSSVLGILWEAEFRHDFVATLYDHNWIDQMYEFGSALEELERLGLTAHGFPTHKTRQGRLSREYVKLWE